MRLLRITALLACLAIAFVAMAASRYNTNDGVADTLLVPAAAPVEWQKLLNPKTDDFWREGNHVPDAGFVIFAKNPTKENAKFWLMRNELKAKRMEQMLPLLEQAQMELIKAGLMEDRYDVLKKGRALAPKNSTIKVDLGNSGLQSLTFYFIYSPDCPHCQRLATTIQSLPNVHPLQATQSGLKSWPGLPASRYATKETLATYVKDGRVPVLIVHDRESNNVQILKGAVSRETILLAASNVINSRRKK